MILGRWPLPRKVAVVLLLMLLPLLVNMLQLGVGLSPGQLALLLLLLLVSDARCWRGLHSLDLLVGAFALFSLATLVLYGWPGNHVGAFAYVIGINIAVVPMLTYLVGRAVNDEQRARVAELTVLLHAGVIVLTIALHLWRPDFYTAHLMVSLQETGAEEEWQFYARLQGFLGSTAIGILCSMSIFLLLACRFAPLSKVVLAALFLAGALMTFQRSSMALAMVAFAFVLFSGRRGGFVRLTALVATLVAVLLLTTSDDAEPLRVVERVTEIADTLGLADRTSYGQLIHQQMERFPLGMGLGATTSAADSFGYNPGGQIVDANHLRVLADLGPVGLLLFLAVPCFALLRAMERRAFLPFGFIVLGYHAQAIGTNVFDSYYTGHLYWFYLGLIGGAGMPFAAGRTAVAEGPATGPAR